MDALIRAGRAALARAAWAEARELFEESLAHGETVEALLGLGTAARWGSLDGPAALAAHERAYRAARAAADDLAAARAALELAFDAHYFRGAAEANGWLERAGHLLERVGPASEHALLLYLRANRRLSSEHDAAGAATLARDARAAARAAGSADFELLALALEGLALVADCRVDDGMARLDEAAAAAVAGEVEDVRLVEVICCHLIDACKRVRDWERAGEWCRRVEEVAHRHGDAEMFATCRTHYADVLVWRCSWPEAEAALTASARELAPMGSKSASALVRLAELRRRQGRLREAEGLAADAGRDRHAGLVRGAIALERGDPRSAADEAARFLRRVGHGERAARVPGLELLLEARLALGEDGEAAAAADELEAIAATIGTPPLRASALLARGRLLARTDAAAARAPLEDAADLYAASEARYEAAHARLDLARVLRALGQQVEARRVEAAAREALAALGVAVPGPHGDPLLTPREQEVLRLVADGRSNDEIAAQLVLSIRTVERHVANVYDKLGISGRSARAAATAYALGHGVG